MTNDLVLSHTSNLHNTNLITPLITQYSYHLILYLVYFLYHTVLKEDTLEVVNLDDEGCLPGGSVMHNIFFEYSLLLPALLCLIFLDCT